MTKTAADDFEAIRARLAEMKPTATLRPDGWCYCGHHYGLCPFREKQTRCPNCPPKVAIYRPLLDEQGPTVMHSEHGPAGATYDAPDYPADERLASSRSASANAKSATEINIERIEALIADSTWDWPPPGTSRAKWLARKIVEAFPELQQQAQYTSERDGTSRMIIR